jgi:transposase
LKLIYHPKHMSRLRRQYIEGGRHWIALVDRREGGQATKITDEIEEWLVEELQRNPGATASYLRNQIRGVFHVEVSKRRVRQWVRATGRIRQRGRPRQVSQSAVSSAESPIIEQTQYAGIFFPARRAVVHGDHAGDEASVGEV